ncbi:hypothetical protein AAFF_G00167150 [Aldrovandia affinis]|uniref:Uncharacterized protein n=1 Tax=Aldrovandia affinis TaxID=143900 RepID=A0AAD7RPT3_9TELE|nr:hypothetical protein AAFF_G00167150 [Aldrovandia affinis]
MSASVRLQPEFGIFPASGLLRKIGKGDPWGSLLCRNHSDSQRRSTRGAWGEVTNRRTRSMVEVTNQKRRNAVCEPNQNVGEESITGGVLQIIQWRHWQKAHITQSCE